MIPAIIERTRRQNRSKISELAFSYRRQRLYRKLADQFNIYVGDKEDESESLNHSGMIALVDKEGNIRCRYNKDNMPILYYSGLNYEDPEGKLRNLPENTIPTEKY
jgi:protein SCO1/2